jgi:hypothetical protein
MSRLRYPSEIERAARIQAQLQVDAMLDRVSCRYTDGQVNHFDQLRADCGRFWLLWILSMPALSAIGCFLLTSAGHRFLAAIWGAA